MNTASINELPTVRLITAAPQPYIEVWHTAQPDEYQVTEERWVFAAEPGQVDVRHILAVRPAGTAS